jgi:hypothetical protein
MHGSSNVTPAPRGRDEFVTHQRSTILYQAASVTVTTTYFEAGGHRYPVDELTEIARVEQGGLLQTRSFELLALFRGQQVRLFRCGDAREFGQVCRALTRAREHAGVA